MDIKRAFDEANKRLRGIQEQLCCGVGGSYNNLAVEAITSTNSKTFDISTVHSISWNLGSGASITISVDGGTAVSFTKEGAMEFTSLNLNSIMITAVGGTVSLAWIY